MSAPYRGAVVLVTGASGFIGRGLCAALAAAGARVHGACRKPPEGDKTLAWHAADLGQPGAVEALAGLAPWTHLFHLANANVRELDSPLEDYLRLDVGATEGLVAIARRQGARLVVVGSGSVYRPSELPHREGDPVEAITPYAAGKLACERLLAWCQAEAPFRWSLVRLFGVYGPGEHPGRLVPTVIRALLAGKPAALSAGTQVRDLLFLEDAAAALLALGASEPGPERVVNVGSGQGASVCEIAGRIARLLGREDLLRFGAPSTRPHDCSRWVADIGLMRRLTGWAPRTGWDEGLSRTVAWWR